MRQKSGPGSVSVASAVIPLAMLLLTEPELMAIGRSMAHRRGMQPRSGLRAFEVYQ